MAGIACFFIYRLATLHFSPRITLRPPDEPALWRGTVEDRRGALLAVNIEKESLFANPVEIKAPEELADRLAPLLGFSRESLIEKLGRKKRFVWIRRKLDEETAARIKKLGARGLYFKREYLRAYPHGTLAANVIGFSGLDNAGLEGIEYKFNEVLTARGAGSNGEAASSAGTVALTIDARIQHAAEREIERGARRVGARQGAAVVMEVKTGRLLAVAKYPRFDPNAYWGYSAEERRNSLIVDSFEPGSTLKVFAMASLLEAQPSILKESFVCKGKIDVADTTIKCTAEHGKVNCDDIIKYSCNVGIIQAMKRIKRENLHALLDRFGFGRETGIELPGEAAGLLRSPRDWSGLSKYSISLGQEVSVTTLQLTAAFGAIANRGVYIYPSIIERIDDENGEAVREFRPRVRGRVLRTDIAQRLMGMMRGVVQGGTGSRAEIAYYHAAGKTGTAQKSMKRGGYYPDKFIATFVGIAPVWDPELCIVIVLDEPALSTSGGEGAAPVFAAIARGALPFLGIKGKGIAARAPARTAVREMKYTSRTMPDFAGLRLNECARILSAMQRSVNISYSFVGTGRVVRQSPEAGSPLENNPRITLYFGEAR